MSIWMEKTKRTVMLLLLLLLLSLHTLVFSCHARPFPQNARLSVARISQLPEIISHTGPSSAPSPTQDILPRSKCSSRHGGRRHAFPPPPSSNPGCDHNCLEPLTPTPIGSPCGCVLPMRIRLLVSVPAYSLFPMVNELEIEIAAGTYLKQSQVRIMGAGAEEQDQAKTVVDINLVPLGEKFDNTTASLIHDRIWHKKVPLNSTLFGDYMVLQIIYEGTSMDSSWSPSDSPKGLPVSANFNRSTRINLRAITLISISAFLLLLTCLASVVIFLKWRKLKLNPPPNSLENKNSRIGIGSFSSASANSVTTVMLESIKRYTFEELEKATGRFSSRQVLGEGGFGRVYLGTLEDRSEVAVKVLTRDNPNGDREFIAEVEMLSRLHHRNLVKLIGICIEGRRRCLVYELVHNGSVESHLHGVDRRKMKLDWDARLKIALGAARGLAYLHEESTPRVIHRDFKASNVLLQEDFSPKVSDFGLAREATEGTRHISTRVMGTFGYVAPEYAMTGHLLVKSDVYSYGVVLLELLSGRKPVDMSQPPGRENLVTWARPLLTSREGLEELIDPMLRGAYRFDDVAHVAGIASVCVHPDVTHRPFMGEVVQALKLICEESDDGSRVASSQGEVAYGLRGYSSGSFDGGNRDVGGPSSDRVMLPGRELNRSGPLRTERSKREFYRLRGTVSEHALFHPGRHYPHSLDWA